MKQVYEQYWNNCNQIADLCPPGSKVRFKNKVYTVKWYDWAAIDAYLIDIEDGVYINGFRNGVDITKISPYIAQMVI